MTETIAEFQKLINEDDKLLPTMCLSYDTTFDTGDFYLSILTYRHVEFEEYPVFPLMYMIHERRLESTHDFFFQRLVSVLGKVKLSTETVIVSDEEKGIINAIRKNLPNLPRFRCWLHAYNDIKRKLNKLGIKDRKTIEEYKQDFLGLLNENSMVDYKTRLANLYRTKWNQVLEVELNAIRRRLNVNFSLFTGFFGVF